MTISTYPAGHGRAGRLDANLFPTPGGVGGTFVGSDVPSPVRVADVPGAVSNLADAVEQLDGVVRELVSRLAPVMSTSNTGGEDGAALRPGADYEPAPLSLQIDAQTSSLHLLTALLRSTVGRLEV